jgi:hypothetical protein
MAFTNSVGQPFNGGVNLDDGKAFKSGHEGWLCRPTQARTSGKSDYMKLSSNHDLVHVYHGPAR